MLQFGVDQYMFDPIPICRVQIKIQIIFEIRYFQTDTNINTDPTPITKKVIIFAKTNIGIIYNRYRF